MCHIFRDFPSFLGHVDEVKVTLRMGICGENEWSMRLHVSKFFQLISSTCPIRWSAWTSLLVRPTQAKQKATRPDYHQDWSPGDKTGTHKGIGSRDVMFLGFLIRTPKPTVEVWATDTIEFPPSTFHLPPSTIHHYDVNAEDPRWLRRFTARLRIQTWWRGGTRHACRIPMHHWYMYFHFLFLDKRS